jgi:Acyltransferase family
MRAVSERAERTPASRERYVDLLRAVAIIIVVLGHWLISVVGSNAQGRPTGHSALDTMTWAYPITWLAQVIPIFFIVGGYANAASLASHRRRGGGAASWLQDRSGRIVRPTSALILLLGGGALVARLLGVEPDLTRQVVWAASIPLWFLSAYLLVVLATPVMYRLHQRFGWWVLVALVVLVALGDVARLAGDQLLGAGNFVVGWLAIHQIGFFWRDGRITFRPVTWVPLLFGGLAAVAALTLIGPYSLSMIDLPRQRLHNASPPTVALLALTAFQLGLVVLLHDAAERWLQRSRPWRFVVAVNAVVLTVFLWHMSAVVLLGGGLSALHLLPTPAEGSRSWWLLRLPWVLALSVVLAGLVAVFGRLETRPYRPRPLGTGSALPRLLTRSLPQRLLTVAAFAAVIAGLFSNTIAPTMGDYLFGMPLAAFVAYAAGAAVLRLLRSLPAPGRPSATA